jgi:uncharacterized protein YlxW (UPF0749 family)
MKTIAWILGLIVLALIGYLLFNFFTDERRAQDVVYYEVSADSVRAFREQAAELRSQARLLRARLEQTALWDWPSVQERARTLDRRVEQLDSTIAAFENTRRERGAMDLYRQCLLLYGQAAGMCEALATDTLPPKP